MASDYGALIGTSAALARTREQIGLYAPARAPVLLVGETGTGKELAARALHYGGPRADKPFVPVNCGALTDGLFESELFGHARGSFTGAHRARTGLIRSTEGGTLFLDEIDGLTPRGQVALLRFLEDGSYRPIGEETTRRSDVRIVAATHLDLPQLVRAGRFRSDLMFRLEVLRIELPPLRARRGDIAELAAGFLARAAMEEGGPPRRLSAAALALLMAHVWPGNVRELEHAMLRVHLTGTACDIDADTMRRCLPSGARDGTVAGSPEPIDEREDLESARRRAVRQVEQAFVNRLLQEHHGNISAAARACHMERATFSRMVKRARAALGTLPMPWAPDAGGTT